MEKLAIKNRKGQKIIVLLDRSEPQRGLAFVMHGLGGFKEQLHIAAFAKAFHDQGCTVVRFDTTNTFGESEGNYEHATITSYYEDLEDVIEWAKNESWYQEPFALSGHSLGGICTALYAERHPEQVSLLAPIAPVVSGALSVAFKEKHDALKIARWKETGWKEEESVSTPGLIKRLPWSHMEDRLKYDLLIDAHKLTMPVLLIVGDKDDSTPPEHIELFYEALPDPKELHIIPDAPHTFRSSEHLQTIEELFANWIKRYI